MQQPKSIDQFHGRLLVKRVRLFNHITKRGSGCFVGIYPVIKWHAARSVGGFKCISKERFLLVSEAEGISKKAGNLKYMINRLCAAWSMRRQLQRIERQPFVEIHKFKAMCRRERSTVIVLEVKN